MTDSDKFNTLSWRFVTVLDRPNTESQQDIITLLAVVQALKIPMLPISWQSVTKLVSMKGATSQIYESDLGLDQSFVFKYVGGERNPNLHELKPKKTAVFRTVINELLVLAHPTIREEIFVAHEEGICWDVLDNNEIWPVLVLAKSHHKDLEDFVISPTGRDLDKVERSGLCMGVIAGLGNLHSLGIIHGDIKPTNVLVTDNPPSVRHSWFKYHVQLIDFGCSVTFKTEEDSVEILGRSAPWNAPELELVKECALQPCEKQFTPKGARSTDIFSLAMLCLWTLFEREMSGVKSLPEHIAIWADEFYLQHMGKDSSKRFLANLKEKGALEQFVDEMLTYWNIGSDCDSTPYDDGFRFMRLALRQNPENRLSDLKVSDDLRKLRRDLEVNPVGVQLSDPQFEMSALVEELCAMDYRVRYAIRNELEHKVRAELEKNAIDENIQGLCFQLALCLRLGFAGQQDLTECAAMLERSKRSEEELEASLRVIHGWNASPLEYGSDVSGEFEHFNSSDLPKQYFSAGKVEEAVSKLTQEIKTIRSSGGESSRLTVLLQASLADIYFSLEQWEEVENLLSNVARAHAEMLGPVHLETINSKEKLAAFYKQRQRLEQCQTLYQEVLGHMTEWYAMEQSKSFDDNMIVFDDPKPRRDGQTHSTLGLWKERTTQLRQRILRTAQEAGLDQPATLKILNHVLVICLSSGRSLYDVDLELGKRVLNHRTKILGARHEQTLESMSTLLKIYLGMDDWQDAERLGREAVHLCKETLGSKHHVTLSCLRSLIIACVVSREERKLQEAKDWAEQLALSHLRVNGQWHLETVEVTEILANIYLCLLKFDLAEKLSDAALQSRRTIQGEQHMDTLGAMNSLGRVYFAQGRFAEAEGLMSRILDIHDKTKNWEDPVVTSIMTYNLARTHYMQGHPSKEECDQMLISFYKSNWEFGRYMEEVLECWMGEISGTQPKEPETWRRPFECILEIDRERWDGLRVFDAVGRS